MLLFTQHLYHTLSYVIDAILMYIVPIYWIGLHRTHWLAPNALLLNIFLLCFVLEIATWFIVLGVYRIQTRLLQPKTRNTCHVQYTEDRKKCKNLIHDDRNTCR